MRSEIEKQWLLWKQTSLFWQPNLSRLWKYLYDLSQHAPQAPQDHGNPYYTLGIPPLATVRHEIDFHPFHGPSARDLSDLWLRKTLYHTADTPLAPFLHFHCCCLGSHYLLQSAKPGWSHCSISTCLLQLRLEQLKQH